MTRLSLEMRVINEHWRVLFDRSVVKTEANVKTSRRVRAELQSLPNRDFTRRADCPDIALGHGSLPQKKIRRSHVVRHTKDGMGIEL